MQRTAGRHAARRRARRPRRLPRGRRRHHRDQHLRRHAARAGRVRPAVARARAEPPGGAAGAGGRGRLRHARAAPLRGRLDGTDHEGDLGHRRRHLPRPAGALPRAGPWPGRGRVRFPARRNRPGRAQRQGGAAGHRRGAAAARRGAAGRDLRHDRDDGHDARRTDRGGVRGLLPPPRPALPRPELRHRPRLHDRPPARDVGARPLPGGLRAERRPARRGRALRRDAGDAGRVAAAVRGRRLGEPRRRLLRHDGAAHPGAGGDGRRGRGRRRASARAAASDRPHDRVGPRERSS